MKWNNIRITIFKELRGVIRDKKSLKRLLFMPLIVPVVIILFGYLFDYMENSNYVIGTNYKLSSIEEKIIKEIGNVKFITYKDKKELEKNYNDKKIDGYIIKKDNLYTVYTNLNVSSGEIINSYANTYLENYNKVLAINYLNSKNINPNKIYNNIMLKNKSLVEEESNSLFNVLLNLSITYVLMIIILSCTVVATDATSGEKERGTLETILTFPIKSQELVAGKYLATAILGCISGIISYTLTMPAIYIGKNMFKVFEDISINTNIITTLLVLLIIIVSALLSAGICIALSGKAKTYKEAQSSLQMLSFIPLIPYFIQVMEVDSNLFSLIPIANCGMALNNLTMNTINYNDLLIIILSTIVYIVLIIIIIAKQFKKEEILFS